MAKPTPVLDQIRALRETRWAEEQARQRAEGVKPARRKKVKPAMPIRLTPTPTKC